MLTIRESFEKKIKMEEELYADKKSGIPQADKNKELIDLVVSFGIVGYPLDKILNIIPDDIDHDVFTRQFYDPDHPIAKAYQRGQDRRDFDIDIKLFNLATSGNLDALEKFERRKRLRDSED